LIVLVGAFIFVNRPQLVTIDAPISRDFPAVGFSHQAFEKLLTKYVDDRGDVAYESWHENTTDRAALDGYLAAVAKYSPENAADRFETRSARLAYWIYAYNAYVIRSVVENWPLSSVTDVKAPLEAVTGLGFFYRQRFLFGGQALSLYAVEHERILQTFKDPRVHFVLNCASESCPVLKPELPVGDELEVLLEASALEFVSDERNVNVNHTDKTIILSTIFKWYRSDFVNDLRRRGLETDRGVLNYIAEIAPHQLRDEIVAATDYEVVYEDYDWSLNVTVETAD